MENLSVIARWLVIVGLTIAAGGGILWLVSKLPGMNSLPGTLRFEFSGMTCVIPILGSILLSIVLTVVLNILARLFSR